jgi:hypothetical protein
VKEYSNDIIISIPGINTFSLGWPVMAVVTMRELYSHFTTDLVPLQSPSGFTFLKHAIGAPLLIFITCAVHTGISKDVTNSAG